MTTDLTTVSDESAPAGHTRSVPAPALSGSPFDTGNPASGQTATTRRPVEPGMDRADGAFGAGGIPFTDPRQVLAHPALGRAEKRQLLASWASDACAVESLPNWRRLPETGALVPVDDILTALRALDRETLH